MLTRVTWSARELELAGRNPEMSLLLPTGGRMEHAVCAVGRNFEWDAECE